MKIKARIKARIGKLNKQYERDVTHIAQEEFDNTVKNWIIRQKYRFVSGMGSWAIYDANGKYISRDVLPQSILDILEQETMQGQLGEYLRDFPAR